MDAKQNIADFKIFGISGERCEMREEKQRNMPGEGWRVSKTFPKFFKM